MRLEDSRALFSSLTRENPGHWKDGKSSLEGVIRKHNNEDRGYRTIRNYLRNECFIDE